MNSDIRAQIVSELDKAVAKFGPGHIDVMGITGSWGETMDDQQVLAALHKLNEIGSMFDGITDRAD